MKLTHVRLLVNDFDACFRFYRDVMGFQVQWGAEGSGYADFRSRGEAMVALFSRHAMAETLGIGCTAVGGALPGPCMLVFEAADLDSTVAGADGTGRSLRRRSSGPSGLGHPHRTPPRSGGQPDRAQQPAARVPVVGRVGGRGYSGMQARTRGLIPAARSGTPTCSSDWRECMSRSAVPIVSDTPCP